MHDYWLTQYILGAVGWGYVILSAIALAVALWIPKTKLGKLIGAVIVLGLISLLPIKGYRGYQEEMQTAEEFKQRQAKAQALFEERCKTAGEKIYRTLPNVEGVFLLKVRQREGSEADRMTPMAAAWNQSTGDFYIYNLLFNAEPASNPYGFSIRQEPKGQSGFKFVEAVDPSDGKRYRYTWKPGTSPKKELSPAPVPPRYAIDYEDVVDPRDREYWIAKSLIRVIDTQANFVMGELTYFVFEQGLGSRAGYRQPWAFAVGCVNVPVMDPMHRFFADKVLRTETKEKQ